MDLARPIAVEGGVKCFLGAGLTYRTGDADDRRSTALARSTTQRLKRGERVFDEDVWAVRRMRYDGARGPCREGLVDKLVSVIDGAWHRDEQVAGADLAAVEGDARNFERRACLSARRGVDLFAGPERAQAAHSRATSASSNGSTRSPMIWPVS